MITTTLKEFQQLHWTELQAFCFTNLIGQHAIRRLKKTRSNAYKICNLYKTTGETIEPKDRADFITWFINLDKDPENEKTIIDTIYRYHYSEKLADRRYRACLLYTSPSTRD